MPKPQPNCWRRRRWRPASTASSIGTLWRNSWRAPAFAGFDPPDLPQTLRDLCLGLRSFAELKSAAENVVPMLERKMDARSVRWLPRASDYRMDARQRSTTNPASRPGSHPACRIFSVCEKRRGLDGSRHRSWSTCWRPINEPCRRRQILRDSGSGFIRKSAAS